MNSSSKFSSFLYLLFFGALILGAFLLYNSKAFEQNPPVIDSPSELFWNLKDPLKIRIVDDSGLRNYRIYLLKDGTKTLLENMTLEKHLPEVSFELHPPKNVMFNRERLLEFEIEATDSSNWNFFAGNTAKKKITAVIDTKRPMLQLVTHSYKITKGGTALVIFRVEDEFLDRVEVSNGFESFKPQPFYKKGYYASLITWPITHNDFNAKITAIDMAGNMAITNVNLFKVQKNYRQSNLQLKDDFIDGKIASLIEEIGERPLVSFKSKVEMFKYINEEIRLSNESVISKVGQANLAILPAHEFSLIPFYPLRNGAAVASFGDHRIFNYAGQFASESYHMGLDLASVQNAPIVSTNAGRIVFTGFLGIYGNVVMVDHGLGLMTLYAHMSEIHVQKGDTIAQNSVIGKTGMTGLALGDHLHFGIIVQGQEVSCVEWMDAKWIKESITDVIKSARTLIDSQGN